MHKVKVLKKTFVKIKEEQRKVTKQSRETQEVAKVFKMLEEIAIKCVETINEDTATGRLSITRQITKWQNAVNTWWGEDQLT